MTAVLDAEAPAPDPGPDPTPPPADPPRRTWRERLEHPRGDGWVRRGWLATLLIGALAGLVRFVRLDLPYDHGTRGKIFDEIYYACDAWSLLNFGVEQDVQAGGSCESKGNGSFIVHPPLGKWLIAVGMKLFGHTTFGWRFAAAVAGTLTVIVLVRVTRRMTGSTLLGCLAGLLLTLDGLHFVQSRVAMLDVFLALFTTSAFACLVADRDTVRRALSRMPDEALGGVGPRLLRRPWLWAAGVMLGCALATKWSAIYYLAVLGLMAFAWEVGARRTAGVRAPVRSALRRSLPLSLGALVVLPAMLYAVSWAGWFVNDEGYARHWADDHPATGLASLVPDDVRSWWQYHREQFGFHDNLTSKHVYQSHAIGWLVLARPVSYYYPSGIEAGEYGCTAATCSREVLAIGTPALWWAGVLALVFALWMWVARRDWRAAAALAGLAAAIVPWFRDDLDGRTMFLFYALPGVPFLCLLLALVAGWLLGDGRRQPWRRAAAASALGVWVAAVVVNFVYLYPVLAAQTIPYEDWHSRMWFPSWI